MIDKYTPFGNLNLIDKPILVLFCRVFKCTDGKKIERYFFFIRIKGKRCSSKTEKEKFLVFIILIIVIHR